MNQSNASVHEMPAEYMEMMQLKETAHMLVYPGMTALDLVAPQYVFSSIMGLKVHLVAKSLAPIRTDTGITVLPDITLRDSAPSPTILFIPGGTEGTLGVIEDEETLAFVREQGETATFVTGVCTGTLILGAAGLLKDYRATTHWLAHDLLHIVGAKAVKERVVFDGNRVTGAGVTAGMDFALALAARLRGDAYAKALQLMAEYDPQPPFQAGTPEGAGEEATMLLSQMVIGFLERTKRVLEKRTSDNG